MKNFHLYSAIPLMGLSALAQDISVELRPLMELTTAQNLAPSKSILLELSADKNTHLLYIKSHKSSPNNHEGYLSTLNAERNVKTGGLVFRYIDKTEDHTDGEKQIKGELKYSYTDKPVKTELKDIVGEKGRITLDGNALNYKIEKSEDDEDKINITFEGTAPICVESFALVQEDGTEVYYRSKSYSVHDGTLDVTYSFKKEEMAKVKKLRLSYYPGKYQEGTLPIAVKLPVEQKDGTQRTSPVQLRPLMELATTQDLEMERSVRFEVSADEKIRPLSIKLNSWIYGVSKGYIPTSNMERNAKTNALLFSYVLEEYSDTGEEIQIKDKVKLIYTDSEPKTEEKAIVGTEGTIAIEGNELKYQLEERKYQLEERKADETTSTISIQATEPIATVALDFIDADGSAIESISSSCSLSAIKLYSTFTFNKEDMAKIKKLRIVYYPGEYKEMVLPLEVKLAL